MMRGIAEKMVQRNAPIKSAGNELHHNKRNISYYDEVSAFFMS